MYRNFFKNQSKKKLLQKLKKLVNKSFNQVRGETFSKKNRESAITVNLPSRSEAKSQPTSDISNCYLLIPFVAYIFIKAFEAVTFKSYYTQKIWLPHVDDTSIVWVLDSNALQIFLKQLNPICPRFS